MDLVYFLLGLEILVVLFLGFYLVKKLLNAVKERKKQKKGNFDFKESYKNRGSAKDAE